MNTRTKAQYYYDAMFVKECAANENGIVTDFRELYARENRWAVGPEYFQLRKDIKAALGFDASDKWWDIPEEYIDEAEALYWSARYGEAQLHYDEIMERRRADWDKYY